VSVRDLSWPLARLGEGIEELVRRAGLRPTSGEPIAVPVDAMQDGGAELARWIAWAGDRLGVEAEPVDITPSGLEPLLLGAGPAVLQIDDGDGPRFFLLLKPRFGLPRLLGPDLTHRTCRLDELRDALFAAHEAPLIADIDRLLDVAQVPAGRLQRVRSIMARERLGSQRIGGCWLLRLPATAGFWRQLRQASVPRKTAAMLGLFAVVSGLELVGWRLIGDAALNGRFDLGWLAGWSLLVLSTAPLALLGGWFNSMLTLDASRLLKTRLLDGALRLDVEAVRHQGVGQLLGRVMESHAFESLALNGGIAAIVAVVELAIAAWVLSLGAGGMLHVVLLGLWLFVAVGMSLKFFPRLRDWTLKRLDMTHELVERMTGHRTTLAQELPERRDRHEDASIKDYLNASRGMDRSVIPFVGGVANGWMLIGLAGLAPAFVSGSGTPAGLAIGLGGVLLANRAFGRIVGGLSAAAQAVIAWKQVRPLFEAAAPRPASTLPYVVSPHMQPRSETPKSLIEAESLTYRYGAQGDAVLKGASLSIRRGERLLMEGPSGGGKSTLASLLIGLRHPDSGLLLLNGLDRHTLGDSWHQFATEAPQFHENHILSGTIGFNLLMGRHWPATDDELKEAHDLCVELGLGDLLARMPSGMMQTIGETGWQLSHGERSRIFLARALLQDAQLTVLDESFAALDPETLETCLSCAMRRARTLIVIAHP
jgi:ATP-binding cassette subfamily B protein